MSPLPKHPWELRAQKRAGNCCMPKNNKDEANVRRSTPGPWVTAGVSLAPTLILALSRLAGATTINANIASHSDVAAPDGAAAEGAPAIIPAGTLLWARPLP